MTTQPIVHALEQEEFYRLYDAGWRPASEPDDGWDEAFWYRADDQGEEVVWYTRQEALGIVQREEAALALDCAG